MTLGSICENTKIKNVSFIAHKLLDDQVVIINEGGDIKFEQLN